MLVMLMRVVGYTLYYNIANSESAYYWDARMHRKLKRTYPFPPDL